MNPAFHSIVVHVLTGAISIGAVMAVVLFALRFSPLARLRHLSPALDLTALWSIWIGTVVSVAGMATGLAIHSVGASLNSPVLRNKTLAGLLLILTFALYLFLRHRYGAKLWNNDLAAGGLAFLAVAGLHWNVVVNSIGGDVAGVPSGYETIVAWSGVDTRFTYYLPTWTLITIAVISVAMLVIALTDRKSPSASDERANAPVGD